MKTICFLKLICILLFYLENNSINGQTETDTRYFCNAASCSEITCSDKPLNCSTIGFRQVLNPQPCNCCKYCFNYLKENDPCRIRLDSASPPTDMCGPLLQCKRNTGADEDKCGTMVREPGTCMYELQAYNDNVITGTVGIAQFKPDCDAHGAYSPRQCMPGSICFCMSDAGKRIFGVGFPNVPMDCACARDIERIKSFGFEGAFPHCLPNGNYDELQCSVYTRRCHCLNKPQESVAIQNMRDLPCFDKDQHPAPPDTPYLRPCELELSRINYEMLKTGMNGSSIMVSDQPKCGPDGNYDLIQSRNQKWICTDPSGNQIEYFESDKTSTSPGDMNCFCALTRYMSSSSTGKPKCCPNGNFYSLQCSGKTCYCVDNLGRQDMSSGEVSQDDMEDLPCFQNPCQ